MAPSAAINNTFSLNKKDLFIPFTVETVDYHFSTNMEVQQLLQTSCKQEGKRKNAILSIRRIY